MRTTHDPLSILRHKALESGRNAGSFDYYLPIHNSYMYMTWSRTWGFAPEVHVYDVRLRWAEKHQAFFFLFSESLFLRAMSVCIMVKDARKWPLNRTLHPLGAPTA